MSENASNEKKKETGKVYSVKVGESIGFTSNAIVIKIQGEANKELYRLPENIRRDILDEAVELSKGTIHPYDVSIQEVLEAKKKKGI